MKLTLVSHASVIIETSDCKIWTDPWLFGKAFMEAWSLFPPASWDDRLYDEIDYMWISHEHPDHFHIPTLRNMPQDFKDRVTVLFQETPSDKMPKALRKMLGFKNVRLLKHREVVSLTSETSLHVCQVGSVPDSSLAVINQGFTLLNVNDCEISSRDCALYKSDLGKVDLVLNQFSIAGYRGHKDFKTQLAKNAARIVANMIENHRDLGARATIPFASFVYFSDDDNRFVNHAANTPQSVRRAFEASGLRCDLLYPGDTYDSDREYDSGPAIAKFEQLYADDAGRPYRKPPVLPLDLLKQALVKRHSALKKKHPRWLLRRLKPLNVQITDLDVTIRICLRDGTFETTNDVADIVMGSEAFQYAFQHPWGISTISVAAKYLVLRNGKIWNWYKIVSTLNNAQFYLKPKYLLSRSNLDFLSARFGGGLNQLFYKWKRMST